MENMEIIDIRECTEAPISFNVWKHGKIKKYSCRDTRYATLEYCAEHSIPQERVCHDEETGRYYIKTDYCIDRHKIYLFKMFTKTKTHDFKETVKIYYGYGQDYKIRSKIKDMFKRYGNKTETE